VSGFNGKLVIDLFEERDALKADVVRLTLKVAQLYEEAEEQKQRIQSLIEERDRANRLAEWKWSLRGEFQSLLGTDNIEEGIKAVKALMGRIKRLEKAVDAYQKAYTPDGHVSPHDCFATGPKTGNPWQDFLTCPGCWAELKAKEAKS